MDKINNVYDLLDLIRPRAALYIGDNKLSSLSAFLSGYFFSESNNSIEANNEFPPFWYFHEWAMVQYKWYESTAGWKHIILKENNNDEERSLVVFFEMMDDFRKLHPISMQQLKISEESLAFHHSDKCQTKRIIGKDLSDLLPLHDKADELLLVKFSHSFGYSFFVLYKGKLVGTDWTARFKDIASAKHKIESLFGPQNNYEQVTGDLTAKLKQVL